MSVRVFVRYAVGLALLLLVLGTASTLAEALVRARLGSPVDRIPTALYARPTPWERSGRNVEPTGYEALTVVAGLERFPLEYRIPVRLADVPDHLVQAVITVEDQRFHYHHGIDVPRIGGALLANFRAGGITQGGSTLTQQLAKNLFLTASRTPLRKFREAIIAVVLEARYDKDAILEAYLNEIYLGQDGGRAIHGVGAAARFYFGKDLPRIGLPEAALLAGMIRAPNRYAPTRNPELARQRRALVLELMREQGRVSKAAADRARRAALPRRAYPTQALEGRWFRDFAQASLPRRLPARGVALYTTLDAGFQAAAERAVREGLRRFRAPGVQAAFVALDHRTGEVLALVGGRDYGSSQFNRATAARRQPGSAFKPVVALTALERWEGMDPAFTLASIVEDAPLSVRTSSGTWQPANYDGQFRGQVTFRKALEQSLNVPFARIGVMVGPARIVATARSLGITSPLHAVPSLALGSSEVSLLELTRAYGVLGSAGRLAMTRAILGRGRYSAAIEPDPGPGPLPAIDPAVAYLVTSALEGVVTRGTGWSLNARRRFEGIAGKTGTSNDWRDAWFIAYSPTIAVGAWVGFDDGRSLGMTGSMAALPIVASFLEAVVSRTGWEPFERPPGITEGYAPAAGEWPWECGTRELFLAGTQPETRPCFRFDFPIMDAAGDWAREGGARAARVLDDLIARILERRRERR